jgi:hypothetical protein
LRFNPPASRASLREDHNVGWIGSWWVSSIQNALPLREHILRKSKSSIGAIRLRLQAENGFPLPISIADHAQIFVAELLKLWRSHKLKA